MRLSSIERKLVNLSSPVILHISTTEFAIIDSFTFISIFFCFSCMQQMTNHSWRSNSVAEQCCVKLFRKLLSLDSFYEENEKNNNENKLLTWFLKRFTLFHTSVRIPFFGRKLKFAQKSIIYHIYHISFISFITYIIYHVSRFSACILR